MLGQKSFISRHHHSMVWYGGNSSCEDGHHHSTESYTSLSEEPLPYLTLQNHNITERDAVSAVSLRAGAPGPRALPPLPAASRRWPRDPLMMAVLRLPLTCSEPCAGSFLVD
eukprot:5857905-Pleurochrysis_carterae.AAC.8